MDVICKEGLRTLKYLVQAAMVEWSAHKLDPRALSQAWEGGGSGKALETRFVNAMDLLLTPKWNPRPRL